MKRLIVLLLGALALCLPSAPSYAQTVSAKTVTACGTPGNTPVVGVPYPITQDTTGVLCTSSSGGGGGAVTIASGADVTEGAIDNSAWSGSGNGTLNAILKAIALQALSTTPSLVNLTQVNTTTLLAGNGVTGAGSPRVTIASDNTPYAVKIDQTTLGTTNGVAVKDINNVAPDFTLTNPTAQIGPYPGKNTAGVVSAATPETCSSGNVANATVACTLATASAKTTYISGFAMTADGATVGLAVSCTLTGTITGTMTFTFAYPAGVAVAGTPLVVQFSPAIPASTTNTTIVASCPASGTGGTNAAMNAWGYLL